MLGDPYAAYPPYPLAPTATPIAPNPNLNPIPYPYPWPGLLIVEDDDFQRTSLRQQSLRVGFAAVHTAATGEEALQLLSDGLAVGLCLTLTLTLIRTLTLTLTLQQG